jgi:tetratricopeptide (TPR) repeat protein
MTERKFGAEAAKILDQLRANPSQPGRGAPMSDTLFDKARSRFGTPSDPRSPEGTPFYDQGGGGARVEAPAVSGSGGRITREGAESTHKQYKSIPGGIVLEGKAIGLGRIGQVRYEPALNAFVIDDRAVYLSPIPAHDTAILLNAIAEDDRVGVSLGHDKFSLLYGKVPDDSQLGDDLKIADHFLGDIVFAGNDWTLGYRFANGYDPQKETSGGSVAIFFTFKDFQFRIKDEELQLVRSAFDARIVPLLDSKAADGGHLPDLTAISAGGAFPNYSLNAQHVGENIGYYRKELIIDRMFAYGEVAAFVRGLKDSGVDVHDLARRVDAVAPGPKPTRIAGFDLERTWLAYLKQIQDRKQFANWVEPPHSLYLANTNFRDCQNAKELDSRIGACGRAITQGGPRSTYSLALAYNSRANAFYDKKDVDRAIADYTHAIENDPKNGIFYTNRADAYLEKRDADRAISDYSKAIALNPKLASAYNHRANVYYTKNDYDRAIADYTRAIDINPKDPVYYDNRGTAYRRKSDLDHAFADYTKAIEIDPKYADAYSNRGVVYTMKKDYDRATVDLTRAIEINPQYGGAYRDRGIAYLLKMDYDRAIADLSKAVDINPKYIDAYNYRGVAWAKKGNRERAIDDFRRALAIDPSFEQARKNLIALGGKL